MISTASAAAHPNIAFIKYWGNRDHKLRIPANGSLSMNLAPLETRTTVSFDTDLKSDQLTLNGEAAGDQALERVSTLLDRIRTLAKIDTYARVVSHNSFPTGTGIASSASAFAALSLAGATSLGLELPEQSLSQLARSGSGSASRSIPGGFVEWEPEGASSYAYSIADPEHWDLVDFITLISLEHKKVISSFLPRAINWQTAVPFRKPGLQTHQGDWIFAVKPCSIRIFRFLQKLLNRILT
jgi:diphosphomevalonate decarboxylase